MKGTENEKVGEVCSKDLLKPFQDLAVSKTDLKAIGIEIFNRKTKNDSPNERENDRNAEYIKTNSEIRISFQ